MNIPALRYLGRLYQGYYAQLAVSAGLSVLQSLLLLPTAYLVGVAFDQVLPSGDLRRLIGVGVAMLGLNLAFQAVSLLARRQTTGLSKAITVKLRTSLLEGLYARPRAFFSQSDGGRLPTRLV